MTFKRMNEVLVQRYQSYLPNAFSDELSLLQKTNKLIEFLNEVIRILSTVSDYVEDTTEEQNNKIAELRSEFEDLKEYMLNEGLKNEIIVVLDEWFANGKLAEIINDEVFSMKLDTSTFEEFKQELATSVKDFGATGNGIDSDVDAIIAGSTDNQRLLFPSGTYVIDKHMIIENVKNLTWVAIGEVTILDTCKNVMAEDGTLVKASNGILFNATDIVFEGSFYHDNTSEEINPKKVAQEDVSQVIPYMDFHGGDVVFTPKIKGLGLPHGTSTNENESTSGAYDLMSSSYLRFYNSKNVEIKSQILSGSGGGEFYSVGNVENVIFHDTSHYQNSSEAHIWSLAKIINCDNVRVRNIRSQSTSTGSFMDISAENTIYEDVIIDMPNGKLLDVTQEWSYNNVPIGSVIVKNCIGDVDRLVFVSKKDNINLKPIDYVEIDNVVKNNNAVSNEFINAELIKRLLIKNLKIHNYSYVNGMYVTSVTDLHDFQTVDIDNVSITTDKNVQNSHVAIETRGQTTVKNSTIDLDWNNILLLRERRLNTSNSLSLSNYHLTFDNCIFNNTEVRLNCNVTFKNCEFNNCHFTSSATNNPSIEFTSDCVFNWNSVDNDLPRLVPFDFSDNGISIERFTIGGTIKGKAHYGGVINSIHEVAKKVNIKNLTLDLERWSSDKAQKLPIREIFLLSTVDNVSTKANIFIENSQVNGTFFKFSGDASSSIIKKISSLNNVYHSRDSAGATTNSIIIQDATNLDGITFKSAKDIYSNTEIADLEFKSDIFNILQIVLSSENVVM